MYGLKNVTIVQTANDAVLNYVDLKLIQKMQWAIVTYIHYQKRCAVHTIL